MAYITETYTVTISKVVDAPGWNSGARTIASFSNDGAFWFSVEQSVGIICGLNTDDLSAGYLEITHGFLIEDTRYRVIESGITKTGWVGYAKTAVFRIERRNHVVTYLVNDVPIYTSAASSTGTIFLDTSMYAYGDTISSVAFEEFYDAPATLEGVLPPLTAFGVDGGKVYAVIEDGELFSLVAFGSTDAINLLAGNLSPLTMTGPPVEGDSTDNWLYGNLSSLSGTGYSDDNRLSGNLTPLISKGATDVVQLLDGNLASLIGTLEEATLTPEYQSLVGELYSLRVYGLQFDPEPGTIDGELSSLIAQGADSEVALLNGEIYSLTAEIVLGAYNYLATSWDSWYSTSYQLDGNIVANITFPLPILTANAHQDNANVSLAWPAPVLESFSGGNVLITFPSFILETQATSPGFAQADMTWPVPILSATAITGNKADVELTWPLMSLSAQGGGFVEVEWSLFALDATGTTVYLATVDVEWPLFILEATGKTGTVASATLEWPEFTLESNGLVGGVANVLLTFPSFTLLATDSNVVLETTYAVNLTTGAVTTLQLGEFDKLVTAHGRLYGLKSGQLVYLEGDLDDTSPIPATVRFAQQTFGSNRAKRMSDVYLSVRENDGITLTVVADEVASWLYQTPTDNAPAYGTHKFNIGRGIKFHTAGLILQNRSGGKMDIGGMELIVDLLSRRPKT